MSNRRKPVHFDDDIYLRNGIYWYRGTPEGSSLRVEKSLKLREGALQRDVLAAKKEAIENADKVGSKKGSRAYPHVFEQYLKVRLKEGLSDKTLFELNSVLAIKYTHKKKDKEGKLVEFTGRHLGPYLKNKNVQDIDQVLFNEYCEEKPGITLVSHRKQLNTFLRWCAQYGYLKYRTEVTIPKSAKKKKRQREILKDHEIRALFENLSGPATLYHAMYLLMGIRNMEICKLRWEDVSFELRALRIHPMSNRNRNPRVLPMNPWVEQLLLAQVGRSPEWVFPSRTPNGLKGHRDPTAGFRDQWKAALEAAGITRHLTPHDMRATFETWMHKNVAFTDTQREKMAGADIDVQKNDYVTMNAEDLRGLENSVQVKGLKEIMDGKISEVVGANVGAKPTKSGLAND